MIRYPCSKGITTKKQLNSVLPIKMTVTKFRGGIRSWRPHSCLQHRENQVNRIHSERKQLSQNRNPHQCPCSFVLQKVYLNGFESALECIRNRPYYLDYLDLAIFPQNTNAHSHVFYSYMWYIMIYWANFIILVIEMEKLFVLNSSSVTNQTARRTGRPISNYTNHCKFFE